MTPILQASKFLPLQNIVMNATFSLTYPLGDMVSMMQHKNE